MFSNFIYVSTKHQEDIGIINQYISSILSDIDIPNDVADIILRTGKRIRSKLALDILYCYNNTLLENLYEILALVEIVHFASLLHDDVIDNNSIRRKTCSIYSIYGAKKTILLGDYLLAKIFNETIKLFADKNIINKFMKTATDTAYGAYLEQCLTVSSSFQDYIKIVSLKTASLFQFSATIGIYHLENFAKIGVFAKCFGIIYQIQNDLDDFLKNEYFENSEDYMQGNITYPVIVLYKKYSYLFINKSQENFNCIRQIVQSEKFKKYAYLQLSPYLKRLTNANIYVK